MLTLLGLTLSTVLAINLVYQEVNHQITKSDVQIAVCTDDNILDWED